MSSMDQSLAAKWNGGRRAALGGSPKTDPLCCGCSVYEPHGPYEGEGSTERVRYGEEVQRADAILAPLLEKLRARGAQPW